MSPEQAPTDQKPTDQKPTDQKPTDQKPTDQKPTETGSLLSRQKDEEQKPDEKKPDEKKPDEKKPDEKKPDEKKPDEKIDIKIPEGMQADEKAMEAFTSVAKELGLKTDGAQKLVDLYAKLQSEQERLVAEQTAKWEAEITAKPGYEKMLALAKKATKALADADTIALLNDTWMGSHPGIIAMLAKAGALVSEDKLHESGKPAAPFDASSFYDKTPAMFKR